MAFKLAMLLGLTSLLMVLMVDQTDSTTFRGSCGVGQCDGDRCNCVGGCRKAPKRSSSEADTEEARSLLEMLEGEQAMPKGKIGYYGAELQRVAKEARGLLELLRGEQENIYREENAKALRKFGEHDADEDMTMYKILKKLKEQGWPLSKEAKDWLAFMDSEEQREYDEDMAKDLKPPEWRWSHRILRVPSTILAFQP
ncbi:hypothetical protein Bbelb_296840 [Branchiostoma belcheri]|nr:hypothetical protein Bbelb_296840 [Branchiostoma belcheri]